MAKTTKKTGGADKLKTATTPASKAGKKQSAENIFPVVGLGASAGGLQAYSAFLQEVPADTGAAFVLVHHVDPDHKSLMADLLAKKTEMPVVFAKHNTRVEPNHVYVIPPKKFLDISDGVLQLTEPSERRGTRLPIDFFFRSLAQDLGQYAVAVILSGTGSDGSAAIREVKEKGGIVLVQDPISATHDGMPYSAIATGAADHIVEISDMPDIITSYVQHIVAQNGKSKSLLGENARDSLVDITAVLKGHSSINFDLYKEGTLLRRIERRMALRHIENSNDYLALLKDSAEEARNLCSDLLISVTSFFRDADGIEYLDKNLIDGMVKHHDATRPIRIWVAGCATGEEAYTLAMLFIEKISAQRKDVKLQIFASDVDDRALAIARGGVYPESISEDVSAARLKRFFIKEDHSYRVTHELRDAVVFANQNILSDAPFSKLDLISCRNLMIYLTADAQERVIQMFHFALNDGAFLFLGMSETTGSQDALFEPVSKKYRIFKRVGHARGRAFDFPVARRSLANTSIAPARSQFRSAGEKLATLSRNLIIERYAPAAVLINAQSEALYFEGPTDNFLRVPSGETSRDLLAMAREGLRARLSSAIRAARTSGGFAKESATITRDGDRVSITIEVHPVTLDETNLYLVTFTEHSTVLAVPAPEAADTETARQLELELETTRTDLRNTISDYEQSTEELKAVNEEAMSMNEEFQSTNEELETSKEELQSLNEELTTLNTQLQQKIDDERRISDDLNNLLASSGIATLFLDTQFNIMRFTPATRELFNLISKDLGRSFSHITSRIKDPDILKDAEEVLATLKSSEREIESENGKWFARRILPYRTQSGKIDGVAITFAEVTDLKLLQDETSSARLFAESIIGTVRESMLVLDRDFKILSVNRSFSQTFPTEAADVIGRNLFVIQNRQWDVPRLRKLMTKILPEHATVEAFYLTLDTGEGGQREMVLNARRVIGGPLLEERILLAVEDVTDKNAAQKAALDREARLSAILNAAPEAILTICESGIVGTYNPSAEAIFGYKAEEVLGNNVNMLMADPDKSKHDSYLKHYIDTGEKKIIGIGREVNALRKDGTVVPVRLAISELQLDGKRHFLGILHDLTIDRKWQAELRRAQKMEAVGQLTGGLAHDFNNLLTVVIGNLELLEMRTDDPKLHKLIKEALEASNLGATLTSQLLSFSKKQALTPRRVALNALVKTMLPLLQRTLSENIKIETSLAKDLAPTLADPGQIESAILNLAFNARDAMENGGTMTIETRNVTLDADYVAAQVDVTLGNYVCLSVTDTGVGIAPETRAHVFEPFFTTKEPGGGSGLGLSMVYGFAKQSGGHVTIYSEVGQGTTVNLFLPAVENDVSLAENATPDRSSVGGGETILVVEDDPKVLRLTVARLKDLNYNVVVASDGQKAIDVLKQGANIDLVLSDIMMQGGMNGFDVAEKAASLKPELKILLATGYAKSAESLDAQTVDHGYKILRKPYGMKELAAALRELLDQA